MSQQTRSIDLAQPRALGFKANGALYRFIIDRISQAAWLRYFAAIVSTSENDGKEVMNTLDTRTAKLALLDEVLVDATGYRVPEGATFAQWKAKIPLAHRIAASDMLVATRRQVAAEGEPISLTLDGECTTIESTWSFDQVAGAMVKIGGLVHHFDTPSPDHLRRFNRDSSRSVVVGGSRTSKTYWQGVQPTLIKLYDELVTDVEGYTCGGQPISGRERIALEMDAFHKVVAVGALFAGTEVDTE